MSRKQQQWVYTAQLLCTRNHSVIMVLGEYQDVATAGAHLHTMLVDALETQVPNQACQRCQSREYHTEFHRTDFHTRAELEAAKAAWDSAQHQN